MKVQFDSNPPTGKNRQCITDGIFYCRDSGYFSVSSSNKLSPMNRDRLCNLTGKCFESDSYRIGNKNIPPTATNKHKRQTDLKNLLTILFVISYCSLTGQSFELIGLFTTTEVNDFKNAFGYDLGYGLKKINQNRISFHFTHSIKEASYDDIPIDEESNGPQFPEYYFYKINSKNQRLGLHFNLCHYWIENDNSSLGIGSRLSYYYFFYDKKIELTHYRPYPDNFLRQTVSESTYNKNNRIGLDIFIEFEIKSVLVKRLNLFSKISTGLITYGTFAHEDGGWDDPWLTKWMTINLGLRYNIKNE